MCMFLCTFYIAFSICLCVVFMSSVHLQLCVSLICVFVSSTIIWCECTYVCLSLCMSLCTCTRIFLFVFMCVCLSVSPSPTVCVFVYLSHFCVYVVCELNRSPAVSHSWANSIRQMRHLLVPVNTLHWLQNYFCETKEENSFTFNT